MSSMKSERLVVPVYINEKIVLDMLAIIEDGFSVVSQVNYTEHRESNSAQVVDAGINIGDSILSKLLKINVSGELSHSGKAGENESVSKEKIHTNVSLLSKFRTFLLEEKLLKTEFDMSQMKVGDFIEIEGKLEKNPMINYMDILVDVFRLVDIFSDKPSLGQKTQAKTQKQKEDETVKQIKQFADELKHSGTIDFILSDKKGSVVLSAQEQYLSNDNISEIIGGNFKVLGKVISICKEETDTIDLLRKTTLAILPEELLKDMFSGLETDLNQFNLPELKTQIPSPAVIVIPIAIYA